MTEITYIERQLCLDAWKAEADRMMGLMFVERALDSQRNLLTGREDAVFAMLGKADHWRPVGMAVFYQPEDTDLLWLDLIYVEPQFRRRGIASGLIDAVMHAAARQGLPDVQFGTAIENIAMQRLADANGFGDGAVYFSRPVLSDVGNGGAA